MQKQKSAIMIIEDHPLVLRAMSSLVQRIASNYAVVEVQNAEKAIESASKIKNLALVIMDFYLPGISGVEVVRKIKKDFPCAMVIVTSGSDERAIASSVVRAGADAFASKSTPVDQLEKLLLSALNRSLSHGTVITNGVFESMEGLGESTEHQDRKLTPRQNEVLLFMLRGYGNKEIALRLGIAEVTVKLHVSAILRIFGVSNRTEAVREAINFGVMPYDCVDEDFVGELRSSYG